MNKSDRKKLRGWLGLGATVLIIFGIFLWHDYNKGTVAHHSNCNDPGKLRAHTIFLLDFSDPIESETDRKRIKESIRTQKDVIDVDGKISILHLTATGYKSDYEMCKPQNPKHLIRNKNWVCDTELRGIDKSRESEAKIFCDSENKLGAILKKNDEISKNSVHQYSPLIESIDRISKRPDFTAEETRKIILFSDLLQNTDRYSFYSGHWPIATDVVKEHDIDLTGVEVEIPRMQRQKSAESRQFWLDFFREANAQLK